MHVFVRASPSWGLFLPVFTSSVVGWGFFPFLPRTFGKIPFCFPEPGIQFWVCFFFPVWILKISPSFGLQFSLIVTQAAD
jgi:hypothetical protein